MNEVFKPDQSNPKDLMGVKKPRLSLVPPSAIVYAALAMANGADKYGPYNWRDKKVQVMIYLEAAMRHILQFQDGADLDKVDTCEGCIERTNGAEKCRFGHSWLPHLAHALATVAIVIDALETDSAIDNRPKRGKTAEIMDRFTKK